MTMLEQACRGDAMNKIEVYKWYRHLKAEKMLVENSPRSGHPSTSRTQENVEEI